MQAGAAPAAASAGLAASDAGDAAAEAGFVFLRDAVEVVAAAVCRHSAERRRPSHVDPCTVKSLRERACAGHPDK